MIVQYKFYAFYAVISHTLISRFRAPLPLTASMPFFDGSIADVGMMLFYLFAFSSIRAFSQEDLAGRWK